MAKNKKPQKVKARLIRGFNDRSSSDIRATDEMMGKIRSVFELYGFDPIETPFLEYTDALGKFLPDSDRPNEGVFSLQDEDEQWLSMRYDLTAPLARHVAQNINEISMPYRTFRSDWVFRNERPGPGRFRQFMQFDADIVGAPSVSADAEMCMMMADTMEALGIKRGDYVIRVNNRKVLDGVLEAIGVEDEGQKLAVLRALDKLDRLGLEETRALLGAGRIDKSGESTQGAGLNKKQIHQLGEFFPILSMEEFLGKLGPDVFDEVDENFVDEISYKMKWGDDSPEKKNKPSKSERDHYKKNPDYSEDDETEKKYIKETNKDIVEQLRRNTAYTSNSSFLDGLSKLGAMADLLSASGYGPRRVKIDPLCVRGLEYYTGMV